MPETKNVLLRLDPEMSDQLRAVAEVEGRTISDVAREAIAELIERRRRDRKFLAKLEDTVARHERLLQQFRER
jgi:predicted transcriptional regulator